MKWKNMLLDASPIFMTLCCACIFAFLFANKKQNKKQHFYYSCLSHTVNNKYNYVSTLNLKFAQCVFTNVFSHSIFFITSEEMTPS